MQQNHLIRVDVTELVASRRFGRFHVVVVTLAGLAMLIDGLDTQIVGYAVPLMLRSLRATPADLSSVFTASGLGNILGFLVLAPVADRVGRRPMIVGSLLAIAVLNLASVWAGSIPVLIAIRFLAGFALSGMVPSVLALTTEFMPKHLKVTPTMIVWLCFAVGSVGATPVAGAILKHNGWQTVFLLAGFLPIVVAPLIWTALPESLHLMTRRGETAVPRIRATLMRISRRYDFLHTTTYFTSELPESGLPVLLLFRHGRAPFTLLLWIMFFTSLIAVSLLNNWTPQVLANAALSESAVAIVAALSFLGGIPGGLMVALTADRLNSYFVLAGGFVLSAVSLAAMGLAGTGGFVVAAATLLVGLFALGTQYTAIAVAAASYASALRATGIGWALAAGRAGQIVAPFIGGELVAQHLRASTLFLVVAVASLAAAAAALLIGLMDRRVPDKEAAGVAP